MLTLQIFTTILPFLFFTVRASRLDVAAPQVFQPNKTSVWQVGTKQLVIWDIDHLPVQISNPTGTVYLGYNSTERGGENLDRTDPLAQNFSITDGNVTVTVPNVTQRADYFIVLEGDSGNESDPFTIEP